MYCQHCGENLPNTAHFCTECGKSVTSSSESESLKMSTELSSDGRRSLDALRKRFLNSKSEASPPKKSCVKPALKKKETTEDIQVHLQVQILDRHDIAVKRVFPTSEDILSGKISITVPIKSTGVYWINKVQEYFHGNYNLQLMRVCSFGYSVVENPEDYNIANLKCEMKKLKKKASDLQAYVKFVDKERSQLKKIVTCNQSQAGQERSCVKKDKDHVTRVTESRTTSTTAVQDKSIEMKIRKEDGAIKTVAFQAEYEGLSSDEDTTLQLTSQAGGGKEDKVLILVERLSMYEAGVQSAKSAGDTSKQKRYGRALKTIQDLLQQTHQGKLVDESDIPPRIPVDEPKKQRPEGATKQSEIQPTVKPTTKSHSEQPSTSPSSQQTLELNNEPTSPSHEIETEQMIETKRDQYKTTTLQPKQSGDINTAISNVQTAKIPSQMSGHGSPQDRKPVPKIADQVGFGGEKMSTGKRPDRKFEDSPYIQEDSLRIDISDSEEDTSEASLPTMNIVKKMKRVETGCNLLTLEEKKKLRHDMAKDFVPGKPGLISKEFMVLNKDSIYSRYFDSSTTIKGLYNWIVATIPYEMLPAKFILKCLQSCKEVDCCHAFPISTVMDRDVFLRSVPTKLMISPICDNPETTFTCYDEVYFSYGDL